MLIRSLQGQGGGRIPMGAFSYEVTRQELARIIDAMPTEECRAMHLAARQGDLATAQRLLREAAATYYANAPATPAITSVPPKQHLRQARKAVRIV